MNMIFLTGHVGGDPLIKTLENNRKVMTLSLATSKRYKAEDGTMKETPTQWHNVVAWGYLADVPAEKGSMLHVVGEVTYRKYTDKDGVDRYITDVVATEMHVIRKMQRVSAPAPIASDDPFAHKYNKDADGFINPPAASAPTIKDDLPF